MSDTPPPINAQASITLEGATVTSHAQVRSPIPDDHHYYARIGRITAHWAQFEHVVDMAIWEAAGLDHESGSQLTGNIIGHAKRLKLLRDKLEEGEFPSSLVVLTDKLKDDTDAVAGRRNRITHDPWYIDQANKVEQLRSKVPGKGLTFGFVEVSSEDFASLDAEIEELFLSAGYILGAIVTRVDPDTL